MDRPIRGGAYHWREYRIGEILPGFERERTALLLGCGDGGEKEHLIANRLRPIGLDVRRHPAGVDVVGDAHDLPFADGCFDVVLSMQVFEHLHSPWSAAAEVARVLRPGGWFLGSVAFLKPYHGSYFHMTHRGVHHLLSLAGLETDRLFGAQSLVYSLYGGMVPGLGLRLKRVLLGAIDRALFGTRALAWRLARRRDPDAASERFAEVLPFSFRTYDRLRFAPAVVFRARKPDTQRRVGPVAAVASAHRATIRS